MQRSLNKMKENLELSIQSHFPQVGAFYDTFYFRHGFCSESEDVEGYGLNSLYPVTNEFDQFGFLAEKI